MIRWLVGGSIELRVAVVGLAVVLLIAGADRAADTPIDAFPEFSPALVEIQTEAPGLSSVEVERTVTIPLETALAGTPRLATLRSTSVPGLSSIVLIFADGVDRMRARQLVTERMANAGAQLPAAARPPAMLPPLSSLSRIQKIGLRSDKLGPIELSTLARWTIRPRLMAVPGVANVAIWGERPRELQVLIDPDRLALHGLGIDAVIALVTEATSVGAGGFVEMPNQRIAVSHPPWVQAGRDLARVPVPLPGGGAARLGDVADVIDGSPPPIGDAVINGGPGLLLIVEKQPWANTLDVTDQVERALRELSPGLAGVTIDTHIFRPATFIEQSIVNLRNALIVGCALVLAILGGFLWSWRTALISAVAIPLSLAAAALVLGWRGGTINTMVIAGLVIALGEVVDDAIIDVENIVRRLRENQATARPRPAAVIVLEASLEVRSAIVHATAIVLLVFVPVFLLPGLSGAFFRPLAVSYLIAVLASMIVALTVTPALSLLLLGRRKLDPRPPPLVRWVRGTYRRLLPALLRHPGAALVGALGLIGAAALGTTAMGQEFLPEFKERDFLMHWVGKPSTSLAEMRRVTTRVSQELLEVPGVRSFGAHIGRAELADEVVGVNFAELWISVDPEAPYEQTVHRINQVVHGYPGLFRDVLTYLRERIKEVMTGASASIVVRIYGPELDGLRERAAAVGRAIRDVPGVHSLKVEQQTPVPQLEVRVRPDAALQFGINPGKVQRLASILVQGIQVGQIDDRQTVVPVVVRGAERLRADIDAIARMPIETPLGVSVPLSELADVWVAATPNSVVRENGSRRINVTCDVQGRDLGAVARDIEARVAKLDFGRGYHPEMLGEYAAREQARDRLFWLGLLSLFGITLVVYTDFRSARTTALVVFSLPFALVGGVAAVLCTGGVVSLGSLVGFVTVLGIAARNGIMLVSHYRHLEREDKGELTPELVMRGSEERVAPILMTALATALALLPLVIAGDRPGHEIEHPLAVVIIGGLFTSTALNLLVLPPLYLRFSRRPAGGTGAWLR